MRTLRLSPVWTVILVMLVAAIILALAGIFVISVVAQADDDRPVQSPTEFNGRLSCSDDWQEGTISDIVLGPMGEGDLVRREIRGGFFRPKVDEMSDPRFAGKYTAYLDSDEYIYPGVDLEEHPVLMTGVLRIEDDEGAWQGFAPDAYVPDAPLTTWGLLTLTGEGAYEGLSAVQWMNLVDDACSCVDPSADPCAWDVQGLVFEGEMPPVPTVNE
jgi:hypothetical protein